MARRWIINDLYVLPEMRRERIGSKLLNMAKEFALATSAKDLVLRTALDNTVARALYESQGWIADDGFLTYRLLL
jgi:ribosomal protein S18 acetylase RimI-like enzyme